MSNFFAALDAPSDDEDAGKKFVATRRTQNAAHKKPAAKKPTAAVQENTRSVNNASGGRGGAGSGRGGAGSGRGGAGGGRGGAGGGRGGGNGGGRAPRREFDRRSGTGRGKEGKKDGGGGHNWGKPGDDDAAATALVEVEDTAAAAVVEEIKEVTLDDYEAELDAKRKGEEFEEKKLRKAAAIKEGTKYVKTEENSFMVMAEKKEKRKRNKQNNKKVFNTAFSVRDADASEFLDRPSRGESSGRDSGRGGRDSGRGGRDSGRGGRDSGRGGRDSGRDGRDSGRGGRDSGRGGLRVRGPVNPMDTSAFPSLSTSK